MIQTQTIDIEHVRKVLKNCPHFDKIVNYEYPYGDTLSKKLIDFFKRNSAKDYKFDIIYTSPLKRALITAQTINKYHNVPLIIDEKYDLTNLVIDIDDFTYEVVNESVLKVDINLLLATSVKSSYLPENIDMPSSTLHSILFSK